MPSRTIKTGALPDYSRIAVRVHGVVAMAARDLHSFAIKLDGGDILAPAMLVGARHCKYLQSATWVRRIRGRLASGPAVQSFRRGVVANRTGTRDRGSWHLRV